MSKEFKPFYEFGPFRFYPQDLVLLCNERNLGLSGKPMDVFFVLFQRRGEPVSKEELLKAVWGKGAGDIRNLYRAIATLKKALRECDPLNEYIETLRESGYRFIAEIRGGGTANESGDEHQGNAIDVGESKTNADRRENNDEIGIENRVPSPIVLSFIKVNKSGAFIVALLFLSALVAVLFYFRNTCKVKEKPSVTVNSDGSWTATVPVIREGVRLEKGGTRFEVREGEEIVVDADGLVDVGRGLFGPDGDTSTPDNTMDSPIKNHVGGLEMWVGLDKNTRHYFVGSQRNQVIKVERSGTLTFRVIESLNGYCDKNNSGFFTVMVKKRVAQNLQL